MQAVTSPIAHHIRTKKFIDVPPSDLEQNDVDDATTKTTSRRAQLSLQCKMCFVLTSNTDSSFSNQKHPLISAKFVGKLFGLKEHWQITRNETTLFKAVALYCTLFSPLKNIDHFSFFIFSFKGIDGWVQALIKNSIIIFFSPFPNPSI